MPTLATYPERIIELLDDGTFQVRLIEEVGHTVFVAPDGSGFDYLEAEAFLDRLDEWLVGLN